MYRQVQRVRDSLGQLEGVLREAILAEEFPEMTRLGTDAMVMIDQMIQTLHAGENEHNLGEPDLDARLLDAGRHQLGLAWSVAERMALAKDVREARGFLLDVKTAADLAAAYLAGSMGEEFQV